MTYRHLVVFPNTKVGEWHRRHFVKDTPGTWGATFDGELERLSLEVGWYGPLEGFLVQHFLTQGLLPNEEAATYCRQWGAWNWTFNVSEEKLNAVASARNFPGADNMVLSPNV